MKNRLAAKWLAFLTVMTLLTPSASMAVTIDDQINQIDSQIGDKKVQVETVEAELETRRTDLEAIIGEYQEAYGKLVELDQAIAKKQRELNSATEQQLFYQKILNKLSVFTYRDGDVYFFEVVLGTRSFKDLIVRLEYLVKLNDRQAHILKATKQLRALVKEKRDQLEAQKNEQKALLAIVQAKQDEMTRSIARQQELLNTISTDITGLEARKAKKVEEKKRALAATSKQVKGAPSSLDMVFPIASGYASSFINDWGFARAGNAAGHQGTDIFAAKGTPLVAVADGIISDEFGPSRVGGYRLHVLADNGVDYYYAHLNNDTPGTDDNAGGSAAAFAPGIGPGTRVSRGQIVGYVGDSGDAEPTPPHLHFGIRVDGQWVNPYPYLVAVR